MTLENVLNITNTISSLYVAMREQIKGLAVEYRNVLQASVEIPKLTPDQVAEEMSVIPNDL